MPQLGLGDRLVLSILVVVGTVFLLPIPLYVAFVTVTGIVAVGYLWHDKSYWQHRGIPQPKVANLWLGNSIDIARQGQRYYVEKLKRLGPTYGDYNLGRHELVTMDLELIKSVFIKECQNFADSEMQLRSRSSARCESMMANMISFTEGEHYKRIRALMTPTFTAMKMNKTVPGIEKAANRLIGRIARHAEAKEEVPLDSMMHLAAMDIVATVAFGEDVHEFDCDSETPFHQQARIFYHQLLNVLGGLVLFPFLWEKIRQLTGVDVLFTSSMGFLREHMEKLLKQRRAEPDASEKYNDLFQSFLNAFEEWNRDKTMTDGERAKRMTENELFAQSIMTIAGSYGTIATLLQCALYHLAMSPEIQSRLQREIDDVIGDSEHVTFEHIGNMPYLSQVVNETLRIAPPFIRSSRMCSAPMELSGIQFEQGTVVVLPIYAIHHNPAFYVEPEKFEPDRFSAEGKASRDPLAFIPFGAGPRNCVGYRMAEYSARVILTVLLRHYRFETVAAAPDLPLDVKSVNGVFLKPAQELHVMAVRRERKLFD